MRETCELLLATQNHGKLNEMRQLLVDLPVRVMSLNDFGEIAAPDETGSTFLENATIKARYYARRIGLLTVADDSGLSVAALDGKPGLHTSRFGGPNASDDDRNRLLLRCLSDVPPAKRDARFTSAVVAVWLNDVVFSAVETVEGRISERPAGSNGFGYDPIFFYPPFNRTFAEVRADEKARVSHRGKAFARLREYLARELLEGRPGARLAR
jgi:XTP/dITP diphosphohydrolase